jgi:phenylpropionate dioxygenase-like ring-hydroxylating dioxygenase large terminal subunit
VQCPYHGLEFDATGACVHNPHGNGAIPKAAVVRVTRPRSGTAWFGYGWAIRTGPRRNGFRISRAWTRRATSSENVTCTRVPTMCSKRTTSWTCPISSSCTPVPWAAPA